MNATPGLRHGPRGRQQALRGRGEQIALALASLALALTFLRPTASMPLPQVDAVVVFDVTQSMNVADAAAGNAKPIARLEFAKQEFGRLVPLLPCGSKLGWGIFTDNRSFLLIEPIEVCAHSRELVAELRRIDGSMAWSGNSEVAKALNSGMRMVDALPGRPALVFVSDGHEAPPISPNYRPAFSLARGKVRGLLLGVGGDVPQPIPKLNPAGRSLGHWQATEVVQVDPRTLGRAGNREVMVDSPDIGLALQVGATPGSEHLSSLRETYLQLLASETGLPYQRLGDAKGLHAMLTGPPLASTIESPTDLRPALAAVALLALFLPVLMTAAGALRRRATRSARP